MTSIESFIARVAHRLRRDFAAEFACDPSFKAHVISLLRKKLPPWPGRPCDENVTRAIELRCQGKSWPEIYLACIPEYGTLAAAERRIAQQNLRAAIRARRWARRRRKPAGISNAK